MIRVVQCWWTKLNIFIFAVQRSPGPYLVGMGLAATSQEP